MPTTLTLGSRVLALAAALLTAVPFASAAESPWGSAVAACRAELAAGDDHGHGTGTDRSADRSPPTPAEREPAPEPTAGQTPEELIPAGRTVLEAGDFRGSLPILAAALDRAPEGPPRLRTGRLLGFALEKLRCFEAAIAVYDDVGDGLSAERVRENLAAPPWNDGPTHPPGSAAFEAEWKALAAELEALGDGRRP